MPTATDRVGRFADADAGSDVLSGFQKASRDPVNKKFIKRQLKPYKKYGIPQNLKKLKGLSDTELEIMAAKAIVKKRGIKINRNLRTTINRKRFNRRQIKNAKRVMARNSAGKTTKKKVLRNTRTVRQHIRRIRANRKAVSLPLWRA